MAVLLLDVNVLVALAWPNHQFHRAAAQRLGARARWATCALTELGFVRISSNPSAVGVRKTPREAQTLLAALTRDRQHTFFDALPSLSAVRPAFDAILGHQQVSDAYLLALAVKRKATLLTFDSRLTGLNAPRGALEVVR